MGVVRAGIVFVCGEGGLLHHHAEFSFQPYQLLQQPGRLDGKMRVIQRSRVRTQLSDVWLACQNNNLIFSNFLYSTVISNMFFPRYSSFSAGHWTEALEDSGDNDTALPLGDVAESTILTNVKLTSINSSCTSMGPTIHQPRIGFLHERISDTIFVYFIVARRCFFGTVTAWSQYFVITGPFSRRLHQSLSCRREEAWRATTSSWRTSLDRLYSY